MNYPCSNGQACLCRACRANRIGRKRAGQKAKLKAKAVPVAAQYLSNPYLVRLFAKEAR